MLVDFSVANFRSFNSAHTLSMVMPEGIRSELETFVPDIPYLSNIAAIYGANGSGKSNLVKALGFLKHFVLKSDDLNKGDAIPVDFFKFDSKTPHEPSEFAISFIHEGYFFEYGFEVDVNKVHKEYLYATPKNGKKQEWLKRDNLEIKIGNMVGGSDGAKETWKEVTRENQLFLTKASQNNSDDFSKVFDWFRQKLRITIEQFNPHFTIQQCEKEKLEKAPYFKQNMLELFKKLDIAFIDFSINEKKVDLPADFFDKLPFQLNEDIKKDILSKPQKEVILHYSINDQKYSLNLNQESDGTQNLFALAGPLFDILDNGYIFIADELHRSLHPKAFEYLVALFNNLETNPNNAQLIFTSHDTYPMKLLKKYHVWLVNKDKKTLETELYSLSEFKNVPDDIKIDIEYLDGIFGGLPNIKKTR